MRAVAPKSLRANSAATGVPSSAAISGLRQHQAVGQAGRAVDEDQNADPAQERDRHAPLRILHFFTNRAKIRPAVVCPLHCNQGRSAKPITVWPQVRSL